MTVPTMDWEAVERSLDLRELVDSRRRFVQRVAARSCTASAASSGWRRPAHGESFNVSILIGLAFAVAASTNLPALLFALFWFRFTTPAPWWGSWAD